MEGGQHDREAIWQSRVATAPSRLIWQCSAFHTFEAQLQFYIFAPLTIIVLVAFYNLGALVARKSVVDHDSRSLGRRLLQDTLALDITVLTLFLSFPRIIALAFRASRCECFADAPGGGKSFLAASNFEVVCGTCSAADPISDFRSPTEEYRRITAYSWVAIGVYTIGVPMLLLLLLLRARKSLLEGRRSWYTRKLQWVHSKFKPQFYVSRALVANLVVLRADSVIGDRLEREEPLQQLGALILSASAIAGNTQTSLIACVCVPPRTVLGLHRPTQEARAARLLRNPLPGDALPDGHGAHLHDGLPDDADLGGTIQARLRQLRRHDLRLPAGRLPLRPRLAQRAHALLGLVTHWHRYTLASLHTLHELHTLQTLPLLQVRTLSSAVWTNLPPTLMRRFADDPWNRLAAGGYCRPGSIGEGCADGLAVALITLTMTALAVAVSMATLQAQRERLQRLQRRMRHSVQKRFSNVGRKSSIAVPSAGRAPLAPEPADGDKAGTGTAVAEPGSRPVAGGTPVDGMGELRAVSATRLTTRNTSCRVVGRVGTECGMLQPLSQPVKLARGRTRERRGEGAAHARAGTLARKWRQRSCCDEGIDEHLVCGSKERPDTHRGAALGAQLLNTIGAAARPELANSFERLPGITRLNLPGAALPSRVAVESTELAALALSGAARPTSYQRQATGRRELSQPRQISSRSHRISRITFADERPQSLADERQPSRGPKRASCLPRVSSSLHLPQASALPRPSAAGVFEATAGRISHARDVVAASPLRGDSASRLPPPALCPSAASAGSRKSLLTPSRDSFRRSPSPDSRGTIGSAASLVLVPRGSTPPSRRASVFC